MEVNLDDRKSFVDQLELAPPTPLSGGKPADYKDQGFIDGGSLVSFTEKVKRHQREDVLNSTLLAQLAADKKYDRESQTDDWYNFYVQVLIEVGWDFKRFQFDKYIAQDESFKMATTIINVVGAYAKYGYDLSTIEGPFKPWEMLQMSHGGWYLRKEAVKVQV